MNRYYGNRALEQGIASLGSLFGMGATRDQAFDQALTEGATGRLRLAQARSAQEEAIGRRMQNAALQGLEQNGLGSVLSQLGLGGGAPAPAPAPVPPPFAGPAGQSGISIDQATAPPAPAQPAGGMLPSAVAGLIRAGGGNTQQIFAGLRDLAGGAREQRAVDTYRQSPDLANVMLRASGRQPYTPYQTNSDGVTTNQATGQIDLGNPMAQMALKAMQALASQRNAAAGASSASAAATRAGMDPNNPMTALKIRQMEADIAKAQADASGSGGARMTNSARKYQELLALNVPPDQAQALAYGDTIERVQDPATLTTKWIDTSTGEVVMELDADGQVRRGAAAEAPGLPTPGEVVDGYRYVGGDPNNPNSWKPAQ